jgi:hypothetical protein
VLNAGVEDEVLNQYSNQLLHSKLPKAANCTEVFVNDSLRKEIMLFVSQRENAGILQSKHIDKSVIGTYVSELAAEELIIIVSRGRQRKVEFEKGPPESIFSAPIPARSFIGLLSIYPKEPTYQPVVIKPRHELYFLVINSKSRKIKHFDKYYFKTSPIDEEHLDSVLPKLNRKL